MRYIYIFMLILAVSNAYGQNYQVDFQKHCQANDTTKQWEILKKWEKSNPDDPELFTSYFNYYVLKSRIEVLSLTVEEPDGESLILKDSLDNTAGFLGSQVYYDQAYLQKGMDKINKGIELYPNRLDMRFGKIYILGQIEDWENFTDEIVQTIQYSSVNKNAWTWTNNNDKQEGGKDFFLSALQDYQLQLYNTGSDDLLPNMRRIASEVLKYYPHHLESLSNLSITYLLTGDYDKAIISLQKAEKVNPKDYVILSNIAHAYKLKGEKKKAIEYYQKTSKYGDGQAKAFAQQQIQELEK